MKVADLAPFIGAPNRVYEVLNKKRALSIAMIRELVKLGIPAEILVQAYELRRKSTVGNLQKLAAEKKGATNQPPNNLSPKSTKKPQTFTQNLDKYLIYIELVARIQPKVPPSSGSLSVRNHIVSATFGA